MAASLSDFVISKRRESFLGHASLPLSASQKRELLISTGSESDLFDQGLLEKVSGQVKEDLFISSSLSLVKLARLQSSGRGKHSSLGAADSLSAGPSGYSSPLVPPLLGSIPPLPTEVAAVRGLGVAGVCLLL